MAITVAEDVNPIKITGTTDADAEILSSSIKVKIKFIRWYNPTDPSHLFHLTDGNGNTIIKMVCTAANSSEHVEIDSQYYGLRTDDLDSGEVYIYIA